jgi:hypothetical protein
MLSTFVRLILLALLAGSFLPGVAGCSHEKEEEEKGHKEKEATSQPVSHNAQGDTVVTLDEEAQKHAGLIVQPLTAASLQPELIAYGRLEEDPNRSFTLRTPVAGIIRSADSASWPQLGQTLKDGATIGHLEPRLGPVELTDLASRLSTARGEVEEISADMAAAVASYENKKKLNAQQEIVSQRTLEEAQAKVRGQEARLKAARETVHLIESSLSATTGPTGPLMLTLAQGGAIVECPGQPGESLEAGQTILRVARYDRMLARVELPVGENPGASPTSARIVVTGHDSQPLEAQAAAIAPTANPLTGGQAFLFQIVSDGLTLRPGLPVTAFIAQPGEPHKGVTIPRSAVLRLGGKTWIYVQTDKEQFTRRAVENLRPTQAGWFADGFGEGLNAVVIGGQALLSMEFTSQAGEEKEED